jgi:flagellar motor switch protein FliN/FliY
MSSESHSEITRQAELAIEAATRAVEVGTAHLTELEGSASAGAAIGMAHLMDVPVRVTVEVGRRKLPLSELARLAPGSLVVLDRQAHEPADILVNGRVVAHGEIVTIDGAYGVRVTRVLPGDS